MSITSKGRRWELLHSLWIGWTFTLGFFNWIAFFYIALRTKQRRWGAWGLLYAIPFVLAIIFSEGPAFKGWIGEVTVALTLLLGIVSIFHAFLIRKEYLLRLSTLQKREGEHDELLRHRLATEYQIEARQEAPNLSPTISDSEAITERGQGRVTKPSVGKPSSTAPMPSRPKGDPPKRTQPVMSSSAPPDMSPVVPPEAMSRDELEYRISSSYPFPLAFGYRSLASVVDPRDLYREQLRVAENMLAFLGSASLVLLREQDREEAGVDPGEYWLTGVSPGDWKDMVARCSRVFARYDDIPLALSIKGLNIRSEKKGFGADVAALIRAKNDYKHDRGPVVLEDVADTSKEIQENLRRCMEALAFFTTYPLRQVEDFDVSRRDGGVTLKCLRYTGDHPSFPQEEVVFDRALPRGDLFLDLGQQVWEPLFPFVTTMTCSHCKVRETYFVDAWDTKRGTARMKSFERGHTMLNKEVSAALTEWTNGSVQPSTS